MMTICVKEAGVKGRGVFAARDFKKNETIETCHMIVLSRKERSAIRPTKLDNYYYDWGAGERGGAIALGFGSLYNHSYSPNAVFKKDFKKNILSFVAIKPIKKGEEIMVNYNGDPKDQTRVWFDR